MKRTLLSVLLIAFIATSAVADLNRTRIAEHDAGFGPISSQSTLTGSCTITYYNVCSGWIWLWREFSYGDKIGVIYDLPADCGKTPGEECTNTGVWWYWRYTTAGHYGFNINYSLYEVDEDGCLVGSPIGHFDSDGPIERWNFVPGLGTSTADRLAIVAEWVKGTLPYAATDNNAANANAAGCGGLIGTGNSVQFTAGSITAYCPPLAFADGLGYIDLIVSAKFSCETISTEETSWGEIKALFE